MKVLQLISSLAVGGSEKLLVSFLASCKNDPRVGFVVVVMNQTVHEDLRDELEKIGIPVYYLNRPAGQLHPRYLWALCRIIRRHGIDLIHAHNTGSKWWGVLCKLVNPGLKLVFTIHDTMTVPRLSALQVWLHQHLIDMNIAISKAVADLCVARDIFNYRQIYNGIELQKFFEQSIQSGSEKSPASNVAKKPMHIVHVGRFDAAVKGQDVLLNALALCKTHGVPVRATLMGSVTDETALGLRELQVLAEMLGLDNEVDFWVNRTDVPQLLAQSDLFVLPSRQEGLGLVVLEAMAAGVPVIVSNIEGPSELVEDGVTGLLFTAADANDLFRKIKRASENPALMAQIRRQASVFVERFDISAMKSAYFELYQDLLLMAPQVEPEIQVWAREAL